MIDNGLVGGAVLRQKSIKEMNELVVERLEANVPRELTRIHNNLRALRAKHDALTSATAQAQTTVADVQNNLAEGLSSQLEYRNAESSFLETKASLLSVAFEQNVAQRRMRSRDRPLLSVFRRARKGALVAVVEFSPLQEIPLVVRRRARRC